MGAATEARTTPFPHPSASLGQCGAHVDHQFILQLHGAMCWLTQLFGTAKAWDQQARICTVAACIHQVFTVGV